GPRRLGAVRGGRRPRQRLPDGGGRPLRPRTGLVHRARSPPRRGSSGGDRAVRRSAMIAPTRRTAAVLALAVALAGLLTLSGTRLAASQGTVLTAMMTDRRVPVTDPWSPFWDEMPKVSVPLSAQQIVPPMGGHRWTLSARAVHDSQNIYLEREWTDPTPDRSVSAPQLFTDAAAVEFPSTAAVSVPALCMGDPNATVNIWQWRAAWQADVQRGFQGGVRHRYPNAEVDWYPFR